MKKKIMSLILAALLLTAACTAVAEGTGTALDAFAALTGTAVGATVTATSEQYLDKVMNDEYTPAPENLEAAKKMAPELPGLSAVTTKDIAVYAVDKTLPAAQVRNKYFRSLANVLRAEIMVNPASEENYKNTQTILSLFLDEGDDNVSRMTREAVRDSITPTHAKQIAEEYKIPESFVEFIVMDDKWSDEDWTNDNSWKSNTSTAAKNGWNSANTFDSLENYVDTDGDNYNTPNSPDRNTPNTPDKNTPNTPDKNTPDKYTPDRNTPNTPQPKKTTSSGKTTSKTSSKARTPDRNTPNTPDRNTPNTPDRNTPNTPDRNTPNTPDRNTPNTPDRNTPNSPDRR